MSLKRVTAPTALPVTLAECKAQARVIDSEEDALLTSMMWAATEDAEHLMGRAVMPQSWQLTLDSFFDPSVYTDPVPITIDLIRGPTVTTGSVPLNLARPTVTAVTSVKYVDPAGTLQTMLSTAYQLAAANDYGARLVPAYGTTWPATRAQPEAVQVVFVCGYADAASVPELIKQWIRMRVAALYENRESWTVRTRGGGEIVRNEFLDYMLDRYRVWQS